MGDAPAMDGDTPVMATVVGDAAVPEPQASSAPLTLGVAAPAGPNAIGKEVSQYSPQTEEIVKRVKSSTPGWEAAREQIMRDMATSVKVTPDRAKAGSIPKRAAKRTSSIDSGAKVDGDVLTPGSAGRGRGRGRASGRGRGGGRGGKRKREDRDDEDDSDSSEIITPVATMTKSGRSIQKPTSFVPPADPSPTTTGSNKRKRTYRKNPESAVCKVCLRGTSPASNMIVFCDGCNTPYHRFCHHPPIDQSVIDEVDKEWYCKQCQAERVIPVPESEVADFIAASTAPYEQRQRYFASLPQGMLVTLLTKATTLRPDLPLFAPDFQARAAPSTNTPVAQEAESKPSTNGHGHPPPMQPTASAAANITTTMLQPTSPAAAASARNTTSGASFDETMGEEADAYPDHPPTYPRPGYGLMKTLPPEQEDLQWLVEDDNRFGVFSHMYQVDQQAANGGLDDGAS